LDLYLGHEGTEMKVWLHIVLDYVEERIGNRVSALNLICLPLARVFDQVGYIGDALQVLHIEDSRIHISLLLV
jgi:hypothetical protein